ncbi:hypothetical protein AV540_26170 [Brevibacillus parabrevis]|uniref:hypothetical protein n=1 Tax=Brevibacillus parabrevis TaxID=54914 RepID=UPI0007AB6424|nr:hypothetical protein [Brevibacillus parabrevis]KZE55741.1 hypothetical protein AV540_26170 [Brevibacillus parabrevis]
MKLRIDEDLIVYETGNLKLNQLETDIHSYLKKGDLIIDSFLIDGVEIFEEPYQHIQNNLQKIQLVEVKCKRKEVFVRELIISLHEYVDRALPEIEELSEQFYKGFSNQSWDQVIQLVEGLVWINQTLVFIVGNGYLENEFSSVNLTTAISAFEDALGVQDFVLAGDVLQYEMIPLFQTIKSSIEMKVFGAENHEFN